MINNLIQKLPKDNNINITYIYAHEQVLSDSIDFTFSSQFVGFETITYLMIYLKQLCLNSKLCYDFSKNSFQLQLVEHRGFKMSSIIHVQKCSFCIRGCLCFFKKGSFTKKKILQKESRICLAIEQSRASSMRKMLTLTLLHELRHQIDSCNGKKSIIRKQPRCYLTIENSFGKARNHVMKICILNK